MPVTQESRFGVQLGCPVGQFDELATIFFGTREQVSLHGAFIEPS